MTSLSCYILALLTAWMFLLCYVNNVESKKACKPVNIKDIEDAVYFSADTHTFKRGDTVRGAPGYIIHTVINKVLYGKPLKVVIAEKKSVPVPTTMICFQSSQSKEQNHHILASGFIKSKAEVTIRGKDVKVMRYFWKALNLLNVVNLIQVSDKMRYIVAGHSLGGALASLFSLYMTDKDNGTLWKNPNSTLITFGALRVGNRDYARLHDHLIAPFRKPRIVYNMDIAPHMPYKIFGYHHASREIWIEVKTKITWKPCGWFRWLSCPSIEKKQAIWHVCPNGDEKGYCDTGFSLRRNMKDHKIQKYIDAIKALKADTVKLNNFEHDQC